jgi:glutamyl-tRNA reductase
MVIGEDEILRQVKEAYQLSLNNKSTNNELNLAFQGALNSAKLIKTDTKLSNTPVSIGTLTVNKIVDFLETHNGSTVLIVGITGQMGSIVAKNLYLKNCTILGTIRSHDKVKDLFINRENIQLIAYKDRYQYLANADVIVSATTSPHYTFNFNEVAGVLKKGTCSKLFIDLAVPCDIDKDIMELQGMELVDIDYFEKASLENNQLKLKELDKARLLLDNCMDEILKNIYFQEFYPSIEKINTIIDEKGFPTILYQLKDSLNKEQLSVLLDSLKELVREEI